ncbi:2415_t:CDS:2 [Entrophospora sp. SA101]|nr:2415_t:CDS:2 [Entrophospora sp. SA101]CAJ0846383.1 14236_t:CDS:2 [Entrophospora sp. SA101]
MVIYEINVRFPDYLLVTAMKALNPSEWPSIESEDFITFGLSELKILVDVFGVKKSTDVNGYNEISPLIDQNECQNEYPGFKTIVATNYVEKNMQGLLPLIINDFSDITKTLDMLMRLSIEGPESKDFDYDKAFIIWNKKCKRKGIIIK